MGCCGSRPFRDAANNDGAQDAPNTAHVNAANSSSRNLRAPSLQSPSAPSSRGGSNAQPASTGRPNRPLVAIPTQQRSTLPNTLSSPQTAKSRTRVKPLSGSPGQTWTRARLETERRDWWDTRVTGNVEVWRGLQAVTGAVQEGDIPLAQALFDAQGLNCPDGQLWSSRGVYDDTGHQYQVPEWLVVEPAGLVEEEDAAETEDKIEGAAEVGDGQPDEEFTVRIRVSELPHDFMVPVRRREPISSIRERLRTRAQLDDHQKLRFMYLGREYADHEILESNGYWRYDNTCVLSCFVKSEEHIVT